MEQLGGGVRAVRFKCRSVLLTALDGCVCQLRPGHPGVHVEGVSSWTDDDVALEAKRRKVPVVVESQGGFASPHFLYQGPLQDFQVKR